MVFLLFLVCSTGLGDFNASLIDSVRARGSVCASVCLAVSSRSRVVLNGLTCPSRVWTVALRELRSPAAKQTPHACSSCTWCRSVCCFVLVLVLVLCARACVCACVSLPRFSSILCGDVFHWLWLSLVQTIPHTSLKHTNNENYFALLPGQSGLLNMAVVEDSTLEVVIAQYWSSQGDTAVTAQVSFRGVHSSQSQVLR